MSRGTSFAPRPPMAEAMMTESGRWDRTTSESFKLTMDYPKVTSLISGEASMIVLPKIYIYIYITPADSLPGTDARCSR